jgi:hypothetical protein
MLCRVNLERWECANTVKRTVDLPKNSNLMRFYVVSIGIYRHFEGTLFASSSSASIPTTVTTAWAWKCRNYALPKRCQLFTHGHGVTSQKTWILITPLWETEISKTYINILVFTKVGVLVRDNVHPGRKYLSTLKITATFPSESLVPTCKDTLCPSCVRLYTHLEDHTPKGGRVYIRLRIHCHLHYSV